MTGRDNEGEGREPRYAHLLQPNRDLAANWAVDVARELENYLAELSLTSLPDEGHDSFNFAEAALLIQGSIQIYSRKVEYLYALVLQALDFIAHKKQAQQENTSIQANGKDSDVVEGQEEDFLNLDDVPEEANIDIIDEENGPASVHPAAKPPASLIVVEGDNLDISGDAGELAAYQISTSSLHRDFLLIDPCDADVVDEYWKSSDKQDRRGTPGRPSSSSRRRTPRGGFSTPSRKPSAAHDAEACGASKGNNSVLRSAAMHSGDGAMDDWHDDLGGVEMWEQGCPGDESNDNNRKKRNGSVLDKEVNNEGDSELHEGPGDDDDEDDDNDPWAPLNPHEPGDLPVMPYKRGRLNRKRRVKRTVDPFLEATSNGPTCSELTKFWQALECLEREARHAKHLNESPPPYEKLRSSFNVNGASLFDAELDPDDNSEGPDTEEESDSDIGRWDAVDEPADIYEPDFVENNASQDPSQQRGKDDGIKNDDLVISEKGADEGMSFEDLCRAHLDSILKNHAESEVRMELATRVSTWKQKIERNLAEQDAHPPFDIHVYGERVLEKLSMSDDGFMSQVSFADIVGGLEKHEVARTFASLLQLVNNGNVSLEKGTATNVPFCFTAENSFAVKLLSARKRHEEMLHYQAPSRASKNSARKDSRKGKQMLSQLSPSKTEGTNVIDVSTFSEQAADAVFSSPPCKLFSMKKSRGKRMSTSVARFSIDSEVGELKGKSNGSRSTPEGKRRRQRQSLKSVQIRLAG